MCLYFIGICQLFLVTVFSAGLFFKTPITTMTFFLSCQEPLKPNFILTHSCAHTREIFLLGKTASRFSRQESSQSLRTGKAGSTINRCMRIMVCSHYYDQ